MCCHNPWPGHHWCSVSSVTTDGLWYRAQHCHQPLCTWVRHTLRHSFAVSGHAAALRSSRHGWCGCCPLPLLLGPPFQPLHTDVHL